MYYKDIYDLLSKAVESIYLAALIYNISVKGALPSIGAALIEEQKKTSTN